MERQKIKSDGKNSFFSNAGRFLWKRIGQVSLLVLVLIIASKAIFSYYTPFKFEMNEVIGDRGREMSPTAFLKIYFSTDQALLPYEPIRVKIQFLPASGNWVNYMRDTAKTVQIVFMDAHLTKSKINGIKSVKNYDEFNCENLPQNLMDLFADTRGGVVPLDRCPNNDSLFTGEAEIYYGEPGDHLVLLNPGTYNMPLSSKVQIGSSIDLNSKKTNDVIYILTALNLIFILYTEFFKKQDKTSPKA
jgi:hypothetical protein